MALRYRAARWASAALLSLLIAACGHRDGAAAQGPYAREVADAIPKIEKATGLKYKRPPVVQRKTKEQVRDFLLKQFDDERSQEDLAAQQILLRRLGLIPDTLDFRKMMLDLYTEQIVGFYDPDTKVLYVVDGAKPEQLGFVIEHELVHALQDQYTNLDSLLHLKGDDDRVLAAQSVMEGQATLVPIQAMLGPAAGLPGGWEKVREMIRENSSSMPKFAAAPEVLQETLIFPYLSGAEFMRRFDDQEPGKMPFGAAMPVSSTQIMHPSAYFGASPERPVSITLPAPRGATSSYQNDMGEFETRLFLFQHLKDQDESIQAAAGWSGDRYAILHSPHGDGIAWVTVWRSAVDAGEFTTAMQKVLAARYPDAKTTAASGVTRLTAAGRSLLLTGGEVNGHEVVLYVDVPSGDRTDVYDLTKIEIR
jgi:Zn-dependent peptidase ImmA (M78 family)